MTEQTPRAKRPHVSTYIDRGGTFTDIVHVASLAGGREVVAVRKVPSDRAVMGDLAEGPLVFGTTVATNALLERKGVPTALFVSAGFADLHLIGDQRRLSLFDPDVAHAPLSPVRVYEVEGRVDADGVELEPLVLPQLTARAFDGVESVAIALMHGGSSPGHERAVAAHIRAVAPHLHIVCGHEVALERGYLARLQTTLVDAAMTPVLHAALRRDRIPSGAKALQSDGSLVNAEALRAPRAVLSGPAGGVLAVAAVAAEAGFARAIGLDMGGTSTDICCVDVQSLSMREGVLEVAGVQLRTRMLEVETIAAGGGSILASDGIRLTVGPESAGADPGPQAYGRGGPPTLTDAVIAAGLLAPDSLSITLNPEAICLPGDPHAFIAIAREAMAQAVRRLALGKGLDPAAHVLVAYGGAGPQHAAAVAELVGIDTVIVHPAAPVFCAFGASLAVAEAVEEAVVWRPLAARGDELSAIAGALAERLAGEEGRVAYSLFVREVGADHTLEIPWDPSLSVDAIQRAFDVAFRLRYGVSRDDRGHLPLEVERLVARSIRPRPTLPRMADDAAVALVSAVVGPTRIVLPWTTIVVPAGWRASTERGAVLLRRIASDGLVAASRGVDLTRAAVGVELWQNRFQSLAADAGTLLARLAHSVNIRERLDFSCAIFDDVGRLVANAPHVPVHLGAMGETVRDLIAHVIEPAPGSAYLTNDPRAGGSHLPDLTVVTVAAVGVHRFFVASRAHHADVGGLTPGSMPPHSRTLADEGLVFRRVPLIDADGRALYGTAEFARLVSASRQPATLIADLESQLAANHLMTKGLEGLGDGQVVCAWMGHLRAAAREAALARILELTPGEAHDDLDGQRLHLNLSVSRGENPGLVVDFTGTTGPHPGNLNAPSGVVRASILYALRVLIGREMPLNEGVLEVVTVKAPVDSVVSPPAGVAVVGGNVETSQRIVDLFFVAAGVRAESQGTMNNLVLGGEGWSLYETLAGGLGATHETAGQGPCQVHMTNTRITDPEVVESRLPLIVRRFSVRRDSGGDGLRRGGDGLVRELELRAPATATLLAAWRPNGARGLDGGGSGAPGRAFIDGSAWDGSARNLVAGARVRVETPGGGAVGSRETTRMVDDD